MKAFYAQFTTGQVVSATGVSNAALQSWLKRNLIIGHKEAPISGGGTPGVHRRFSFLNVMEIALIKALTDAGLDLPNAALAAMHFAHLGYGAPGDSRFRHPGVPFDTRTNPCFTLLCVANDRSQVLAWVPGKDDVMVAARHALGNPLGFTVLQVNPLFESVAACLGFDYFEVLRQAYGEVAGT